jgi:D-xylose 1-dehydrogenase (NADP+, D-xylono-1,5-lactone-forming)
VGGDPLRLGVLAPTSTVARLAVLPAAARSEQVVVTAAASRPDYDSVLRDPEVEAVYVPLPNSLHREWTERAAARGKHVLCEKPLAASEAEAAAMAAACEEAGVVLMEAYMTPFHPRAARIDRLVGGGDLGRLLFARAAFTGVLDRPDDHRWRPEMGGGALLDVGIYCLVPVLQAASRRPGEIERVAAAAHRAPLGVDASFSAWLDLGDGAAGSIECSFEAPERQLLEIVGDEAALAVDRACTPGPLDTDLHLLRRDGTREVLAGPGGDPYQGMLEHFAAVVRGRAELQRPPAASVALAALTARLAAAAGR